MEKETSIRFHPNEHFVNRKDGKLNERITDTCFEILDTVPKKYHLECQSTSDSSMLIRMFECGAQIALDDGEVFWIMRRRKFRKEELVRGK